MTETPEDMLERQKEAAFDTRVTHFGKNAHFSGAFEDMFVLGAQYEAKVARRHVLEEAAKAMCPACRLENHLDDDGHHSGLGPMRARVPCKAFPIRELYDALTDDPENPYDE